MLWMPDGARWLDFAPTDTGLEFQFYDAHHREPKRCELRFHYPGDGGPVAVTQRNDVIFHYSAFDPKKMTTRQFFYRVPPPYHKAFRLTIPPPLPGQNYEISVLLLSSDKRSWLWELATGSPDKDGNYNGTITFWKTDFVGHHPRRLCRIMIKDEYHAPRDVQWPPDGSHFSFSYGDQLWIEPVKLN